MIKVNGRQIESFIFPGGECHVKANLMQSHV